MSVPVAASPANKSNFVYIVAAIAAIGGMLFGYDTGVISGAILFIQKQFALNSFQEELVVSGGLIGATVSSIFGGMASDKWGRRHLLLVAAGIFALGAVTAALSHEMVMLVTGRIIVGIGIGLASFTVPLYISEMAPKDQRGWMVSLNQLAVTIGILIAYAIDFGFSASGQWRWMLGLGVVPAMRWRLEWPFYPTALGGSPAKGGTMRLGAISSGFAAPPMWTPSSRRSMTASPRRRAGAGHLSLGRRCARR
jgi:MFS family permease